MDKPILCALKVIYVTKRLQKEIFTSKISFLNIFFNMLVNIVIKHIIIFVSKRLDKGYRRVSHRLVRIDLGF